MSHILSAVLIPQFSSVENGLRHTQTFSARSYFCRNGKIFLWATRREITLQKKLSLAPLDTTEPTIWFGWKHSGNTCLNICISHLFIYSASWSVQLDKKEANRVCCVLWTHSSWFDKMAFWLSSKQKDKTSLSKATDTSVIFSSIIWSSNLLFICLRLCKKSKSLSVTS